MPQRGWRPYLQTGLWIRDHLLKVGKDYVYRMWKLFNEFLEANGMPPVTYKSFRNYIYLLKKNGLIVPIARTPSSKGGFYRTWYTINPALVNDPRWNNPLASIYPYARLGGKRYYKVR